MPPSDSLPNKANGPKDAKLGGLPLCPPVLTCYLSTSWLGKVCQGPECPALLLGLPMGPLATSESCWWPQGVGESVAGGTQVWGSPSPGLAASLPSTGGFTAITWVCFSSFPSSLTGEWDHWGSWAGPHHGVTPFPSALLQPELGMALARCSPAAQGV